MNNLKIIDINKKIIKTVPKDSFIFSVLTDEKTRNNFILHNYIETYSLSDEGCYSFFLRFKDMATSYALSKYFDYSYISREILNINNINIIDIIKKSIDLNYCVLLTIDAFYIKNYIYRSHFSHELMIYGYDDLNGTMYIQDYFNEQYTSCKCTYDEIVEGYIKFENIKEKNSSDGILLLKTKEQKKYEVFPKEIIKKLENFIYNEFDINSKKNYGITIFDLLVYQLDNQKLDGAPYNYFVVHTSFIKDHMELMRLRIKELIIFNENFNFLLNQINDLIEEVTIVNNNFIKKLLKKEIYSLSQNSKYINLFSNIKQQYYNLIERLIGELKNIGK